MGRLLRVGNAALTRGVKVRFLPPQPIVRRMHMNKYDCKYRRWIETDYDIISGHSDYEVQCMRPDMKGKHCLYCYCKFREQ